MITHTYNGLLLLLFSFCLSLLSACHEQGATQADEPQAYDESAETLSDIDNSSETDPISSSYRPPSDDHTEIVEVPETGVNLGWGWDQHDAEPVRTVCVEFVEASEPAQTRYMTMKEVSDSYELMQSMGMSAQASVKTIGFEAKGKAAFAKETNITGYSSNFVMNATVENGVRYTAPAEAGAVQLTQHALNLAATNLDEFEHQCGDGFVSAVYAGAKLTALITIETKSQQEKEEMSATMSGSGWGGKFEASVNQKSGSKTEGKNMSFSIFQTGGRGDSIPKDKKDLLDKLDVLPAIAFDAPKDFHMAITPYDSLANWPAQTLDSSEDEFEQLASYWGAYNTLYDEIQYVLDHPLEFASPIVTADSCIFASDHSLNDKQIERLKRVQDDVLDALHRIENFARYCSTEEEGCIFPEHIFRNPYAYRSQLPLEIYAGNAAVQSQNPEAEKLKAEMKKAETALLQIKQQCDGSKALYGTYYFCQVIDNMLARVKTGNSVYPYDIELLAQNIIVDLTKRRCQNDKTHPLCLSNSEIDDWRNKMTHQLIKFNDLEQRDKQIGVLNNLKLKREIQTCLGEASHEGGLYTIEPGFPAIWYHPSIEECVKGNKEKCPELAQSQLIAPSTETN